MVGINIWLSFISAGSIREGLDLVKEAISRTGYNEKIKIAIDVAATDFCIGDEFFPVKCFYAITSEPCWHHYIITIGGCHLEQY